MANPPKQKGTAYETKMLRRLQQVGFTARRTPPGSRFDLDIDEAQEGKGTRYEGPVRALFTEPDFGRTLVTVTLEDFMGMLNLSGLGAHIECKKWKAFPHHTLWKKEME